mmetsp:Transcript_39456/g.95387  ORF Transcript_39456/g.95387 Transcript_39456/m.95387 type:complete len:168 (-) Transcript_39456:190-693(-)
MRGTANVNFKEVFPTKMNYHFNDNAKLRIPTSAHIHFGTRLAPQIQQHFRRESYASRSRPIVYKTKTYFPLIFGRKDLCRAFKQINETTGWATKVRANKESLVGELDNGHYKVRTSLHGDHRQPCLISAYPVSIIDRYQHPDFSRIHDNDLVEKASPRHLRNAYRWR